MSITSTIETAKHRPIFIGLIAVLAVFSLGIGIAVATGLATPHTAEAQVVAPPCCTVPPPAPPPPAPPPPPPPTPAPVPTPAPTPPPPPPGTCDLDVSPGTIAPGETATLSWHVTNSSYAEIDHGIGGIDANGTNPVHPTVTTTYTLTANTLAGPTVRCHATVTVATPPPPVAPKPTCTLSANPTTVQQGSASTLHWSTTNASSVSIDHGIGSVATSGGRTVVPNQTTTYTLTATGQGGTVHCTATVAVQVPQTPAPTCSLDFDRSVVAPGETPTLFWSTQNATSVSIDHGIGSVPASSARAVAPVYAATTYTLTATGGGHTVHCTATVTVSTPQPSAPTCTLSANPTTIQEGGASTLHWTTKNASSVSLNQGIGSVSSSGSYTVTPDHTTSYTLTVIGTNGQTIHCSTTVVVHTPQENEPTCTLSVSPSVIHEGDSTRLSWSATNATSFTINQGIGSVDPDGGSRTVYPGGSRTYVGTATGPGGTVTCSASVSTRAEAGPSCSMSVSPSRIDEGDDARLSWDSSHVYRVRINQGIGEVNEDGSMRVSPHRSGTYTYEGTFYGDNGETIRCSATLRVRSDNQNLVLDSLPIVGNQPLSYVYLSDIPYTGLDLGPVGTAVYWLMLILWSLAVAFVLMKGVVPFAMRTVGIAPGAPHTPTPAAAHAPAPHTPVAHSTIAPEHPSGYEAFKAKAAAGSLTVDDIVKGFASGADDSHLLPAAPSSTLQTPVSLPGVAHEATAASGIPDFLAALLSGNREVVFATLRSVTKAGEDAEAFLTHAVMALDDAYRAKTEGAVAVDPAVAKVCEDCAPSFLEQLITTLSTAVDSSYTKGTTAAKLAVTRALNLIG